MEPRQLDNLTQYPLRNGMVQGDSHDRLAFFLATTHVHEGNVDSFLTQYCPDFADHPRNVFVLEENHVLRRFDVYVMPIDLDQTWPVVGSDSCLLYTSDAADDLLCVDLGGRRIIKKKKKKNKNNLLTM